MTGRSVPPLTPQSLPAAYMAWLASEGKEDSPANGGIFAFELTNFGTAPVGGMTEAEICGHVGGVLFKER